MGPIVEATHEGTAAEPGQLEESGDKGSPAGEEGRQLQPLATPPDVGDEKARIDGGHPHTDKESEGPSGSDPALRDQSAQADLPGRPAENGPTSSQGILGGLKRILNEIRMAVLGPREEREMDDVLFDIRKEVHEAGRRGAS